MNLRKALAVTALAVSPLATLAQSPDDGQPDKVTVHGNVQADILVSTDSKEDREKNNAEVFSLNTYAQAGVYSKYVDGGVRFEYLEHPLPTFANVKGFKGWGVPNIYVKGKFKGNELTLGDFYDQFGSGFILRTYEERSLGIDNSIRGVRYKTSAIKGVNLTALGGVQRRYWDWDMKSLLAGADLEIGFENYSKTLREKGVNWNVGASWVYKHEKDEDIMVPGTSLDHINGDQTPNPDHYYRLNLPKNVNSFDLRTDFHKDAWSILAEYAWKAPDPSLDNNYTYRHGDALMLSGSYSKKGLTALVQAKRSENMSFRSRRSASDLVAFINNMPPFAYQHTYALASLYPYATQNAPGEWAFQGAFGYNFKRKTALGGKYGTKVRLNLSYIRGIKREGTWVNGDQHLYGTDGLKTKFFGLGDLYYQDFNLQVEKKLTSDFQMNLMYMYQRVNRFITEGEVNPDGSHMVNAHIAVADMKLKLNKKMTLRWEVQYLGTKQDKGDWLFGLAELSVLPYFMFSVSDQWNMDHGEHYYMAAITANYRSNRFMLGYGRTREGYNCSGGVCRYVPETKGLTISYNYNF